MILIAELATAHGGDVGLAEAMIHAAAEAGATHVKTQHYSLERLNPRDPQADWLRKSYLNIPAHGLLDGAARNAGVRYLSTPFDTDALMELRDIGITQFKIASTESNKGWWDTRDGETWFVSWPWGRKLLISSYRRIDYHLTAIPLYPAPLECLYNVDYFDGYSDHCEGLSGCLWYIAHGAKVVEVHVTYPGARQMSWDKSMDDLKRLRDFAEDCQTMSSGVARKFRERWSA